MMEPKIKRKFRAFSLSLTTSEASATPIRFDDVAGGSVEIGTTSTSVTSLSIWASESTGSSFGRLYGTDGSVASLALSPSTTEPRVYPFPDACYGVGAVKLVADQAAGTSASVVVMLKG